MDRFCSLSTSAEHQAENMAADWKSVLKRDPPVQAMTLLRLIQMLNPDEFPNDRERQKPEYQVHKWCASHASSNCLEHQTKFSNSRYVNSWFLTVGADGKFQCKLKVLTCDLGSKAECNGSRFYRSGSRRRATDEPLRLLFS